MTVIQAKAIVRKQEKIAEEKKVTEAAVAAASKRTGVNNIKNNNNNNHNSKKRIHPTEQDMDREELLKKNVFKECKKYSGILSHYPCVLPFLKHWESTMIKLLRK